MSKKKTSKIVKAEKANVLNHVVDTENEFAAEFGEELYGGQARVAYEKLQLAKTKKLSK